MSPHRRFSGAEGWRCGTPGQSGIAHLPSWLAYKPYGPTEDELAGERADEAREYLDTFADLFFTLDDGDRTALLVSARGLVDSLERGERPERLQMDGELDI